MNTLIIYLETIFVSWCIDKTLAMKQIKDITENGYKINYKKVVEYNNKYNTTNETEIPFYLIPFYNIIKAFNSIIQYNDEFTNTVQQLHTIGALEELWDIEKEEYNKNPGLLTAWNLPKIVSKRLQNADTMRISVNGNDESYVFFEFTPDGEDIVVLKVIGALEELSVQEQKEIAITFLNAYFDYGTEYEEIHELNEEKTLEKEPNKKIDATYKWNEENNYQEEIIDVEIHFKETKTKKLSKDKRK